MDAGWIDFWVQRQRQAEGFATLAVAVLAQAVADSDNGDAEAQDFLQSPQAGWLLAALGLSPAYCRRLARSLPAADGNDDEWLTVAEAAARCGRHPERLRQLIRAGRLEARGGGRGQRWLVRAAGLPPPRDG